MHVPNRWFAAALVIVLAACATDSPTAVPHSSAPPVPGISASQGADDPHFLVTDPGAATIANPVIQFWAKRGVEQTVRMYYHAVAGSRDSVAFFTLRLRARSLLRRPDGTAFAAGDSVLITLTLADAEHGVVDCQPSGLVFERRSPVTVRISYANASMDDDGTLVPLDASLAQRLSVWRRESATSPWLVVPSAELAESSEVEAEIGGFTGYALAW
jgi:hypothetical protein